MTDYTDLLKFLTFITENSEDEMTLLLIKDLIYKLKALETDEKLPTD